MDSGQGAAKDGGLAFFSALERAVIDTSALIPSKHSKLHLQFLARAQEYINFDGECKIAGLDANLLANDTPKRKERSLVTADSFVLVMVEVVRDLIASAHCETKTIAASAESSTGESAKASTQSEAAVTTCQRIKSLLAFALRLIVLALRVAPTLHGMKEVWELLTDTTVNRAVELDASAVVLQALRCIFRPRRHPNSYFLFSGMPLYPIVKRAVRKEGYSWFSWVRMEELKEGKYILFSFVDQQGTGVQYFVSNNTLKGRTLISGRGSAVALRFTFQKGRWYSLAVTHSPNDNMVRVYANGELTSSVGLQYPPPAKGSVQYSVGGFHGCMGSFHVFDQILSQLKVRHVHFAGPDYLFDTHRLQDGPVAMLPQIPCIHGLRSRGSALTRRTSARVLVRYVFGLAPEMFDRTSKRYAPIGWEALHHYGQQLRFAPDTSQSGMKGSIGIHISPSPISALLKEGGLFLVLHAASPSGLLLGHPNLETQQQQQQQAPQHYHEQQQHQHHHHRKSSSSMSDYKVLPKLASGCYTGEVISLIADLIAADCTMQSQMLSIGCKVLRTSLLNYFPPTMSAAHGVTSLILAIEALDITSTKLHLTEAVVSLVDVSYWAKGPSEALLRLLRLVESLIERYPKAFATTLGPVRVIDWLRKAAPSAFPQVPSSALSATSHSQQPAKERRRSSSVLAPETAMGEAAEEVGRGGGTSVSAEQKQVLKDQLFKQETGCANVLLSSAFHMLHALEQMNRKYTPSSRPRSRTTATHKGAATQQDHHNQLVTVCVAGLIDAMQAANRVSMSSGGGREGGDPASSSAQLSAQVSRTVVRSLIITVNRILKINKHTVMTFLHTTRRLISRANSGEKGATPSLSTHGAGLGVGASGTISTSHASNAGLALLNLASRGIGLLLDDDTTGDNGDDKQNESSVHAMGGGIVAVIELLNNEDAEIRALACKVIMRWWMYHYGKEVLSSPSGDKKNQYQDNDEYPGVRVPSQPCSSMVATCLIAHLVKHREKALDHGMRELLMAWGLGETKVAGVGMMVEVNERTRVLSPPILAAILKLGAHCSVETKERILLDVLTCLRANPQCRNAMANFIFWPKLLVPYIFDEGHVSVFSMHIAHHMLKHCLTTYKGGWVAAAEMRWCIEQYAPQQAKEEQLTAKKGKQQTGAAAAGVSNDSSYVTIVWQRLLHTTLSALLHIDGPQKGSLIARKSERTMLIPNLIPLMHMVEEAVFPIELTNFTDGKLPKVPRTALPLAFLNATASKTAKGGEVDAGKGREDVVDDRSSKSKKGTAESLLPGRTKSMPNPGISPRVIRSNLLQGLLIGVVEHFGLPNRRQDVLRVVLRFLRYVLPDRRFNHVIPHILGYLQQLFKIRLTKRTTTNIRTLVLCLCLVRDAMRRVEQRLGSKQKVPNEEEEEEEAPTISGTHTLGVDKEGEVDDAKAEGEEEDITLAQANATANLAKHQRSSIPRLSSVSSGDELSAHELTANSDAANWKDMERVLTQLYHLWRPSILTCFPDAKNVVEDLSISSPTSDKKKALTQEAITVVDMVCESPDYESYKSLCRDHEAWFERVMKQRRGKEMKNIELTLSMHTITFDPYSLTTTTPSTAAVDGETDNDDEGKRKRTTASADNAGPIAEHFSSAPMVFGGMQPLYMAWSVTLPVVIRHAAKRRKNLGKGALARCRAPGWGSGGGGGNDIRDWDWAGIEPSVDKIINFVTQYDLKPASVSLRETRRLRLSKGATLQETIKIVEGMILKAQQTDGGASSATHYLPPSHHVSKDSLSVDETKMRYWLCPVEDALRARTLVTKRRHDNINKGEGGGSKDGVESPGKKKKDFTDLKSFSTAGVVKSSEVKDGENHEDDGAATGEDKDKEQHGDRDADGEEDHLDFEKIEKEEYDENMDGKVSSSLDSKYVPFDDELADCGLYGHVTISKTAIMITTLKKVYGTLSLTPSHVIFKGKRIYEDCMTGVEQDVGVTYSRTIGFPAESEKDNGKDISDNPVVIVVSTMSIRQAMPRLFLLQNTALEVFFKDHTSALFNFPDTVEDRNETYKMLCKVLRLPYELSPTKRLRHSGIVRQWQNGEISNFQYLMHINTLAGRTFNDVSQYPVFPWVITDFESKSIDLTDYKIYRDLSKPIGALNPDRLDSFDERFENPLPDVPAFHYGSHYSSPGIVNYFLLRIEPYSSLAISQQGGRFDLPDRLFDSVKTAWQLSYSQISDVKELIPEFYCNPTFLRNKNKLELGRKQNGRPVDDVELPPWAKGSPETFIRIHREALESPIVSRHLHQWIDLIFGNKQRGQPAAEAKNLFYYLTYPGQVDIDSIEDDKVREATLAQICSFGQTPLQLFNSPHPAQIPCEPPPTLDLPTLLPPHYKAHQVGKVMGYVMSLVVDDFGRISVVSASPSSESSAEQQEEEQEDSKQEKGKEESKGNKKKIGGGVDSVADRGLATQLQRWVSLIDIGGLLGTMADICAELSGDPSMAQSLCQPQTRQKSSSMHHSHHPGATRSRHSSSAKPISSPYSNRSSTAASRRTSTAAAVASVAAATRGSGRASVGGGGGTSGFSTNSSRFSVAGFLELLSNKARSKDTTRNLVDRRGPCELYCPEWIQPIHPLNTLQIGGRGRGEENNFKPTTSASSTDITAASSISAMKTASGSITEQLPPPPVHLDRLVAVSANTKFVFVGGYLDACFRCYLQHEESMVMLSQVWYHSGIVTVLKLAQMQNALVTADNTGEVCVWNTAVRTHQWKRSPISLDPICRLRIHDSDVIDCDVYLKAGVVVSIGRSRGLEGVMCVGVSSTYLNRCLFIIPPPDNLIPTRVLILSKRQGPVYMVVAFEPAGNTTTQTVEEEKGLQDKKRNEPGSVGLQEGVVSLYSIAGDIVATKALGSRITSMVLTPKNDYVVCGTETGDVVFLKSWDLSLVQAIVPSVPSLSSPHQPPPKTFKQKSEPTGFAGGPKTKAPPPPPPRDKSTSTSTSQPNPIQTSHSSPTLPINDDSNEKQEPEEGKEVISLAFAPKEQYLVVANRRGDIRLLLMPQSELLPNFAQFATAASQVSSLLEQERAAIEAGAELIDEDKDVQQQPSKTTKSAGVLVDDTARPRTSTRTSFTGLMRGLFGSRNKKQTR